MDYSACVVDLDFKIGATVDNKIIMKDISLDGANVALLADYEDVLRVPGLDSRRLIRILGQLENTQAVPGPIGGRFIKRIRKAMNDIIQILVAVYRDVRSVACSQRKKLACGVPGPIQNYDELLL